MGNDYYPFLRVCSMMEKLGCYQVWYGPDQQPGLIITNAFPVASSALPEYHGALTVLEKNVAPVETLPEVAERVSGLACLYSPTVREHTSMGRYGVTLEPSDNIDCIFGVGVPRETYERIASPENEVTVEWSGFEACRVVKPVVIRPLPSLGAGKIVSLLSRFLKDGRRAE